MQKRNSTIKGKILIVFLISASALIGTYSIYKLTVSNIFKSLKDVALPNQKLLTVNNLFTEINESEKPFKTILLNKKSLEDFFKHSQQIKKYSNDLQTLCSDNPYQLSLIDSIIELIDVRQQYLLNHAKYLESLRKSNPINKQIKLLDSMVAQNESNADSIVVTHERKKTTIKTQPLKNQEKEQKRSFLSRLFKQSKKKEPEDEQKQNVVREIWSLKTDTLIIAKDTSYEEIKELIQNIGKVQNERQQKFFNKESAFTSFNSTFDSKIYQLFSAIESDIIQQTSFTLNKSEKTININSQRIFLIILLFSLCFIILLFLIITDVRKSNKYKILLEIAMKNEQLSNLSKQRFLANMSHEIRTPLQSIIGFTELIKSKNIPERKHIDAIQTSSQHLLQIVNEILDYNRINSGKFTFEKSNFNIIQIVEEVIAILLPQAEEKNIQLTFQSKGINHPVIYGDPFRLKQILLNIIGNGIKFTEKGFVKLELTQTKELEKYNFNFKVTDSGIGILKEKQDSIFEQFEQAYSPSDHPEQGTGLGLSIAKSLIEGQGGSINVTSELQNGSCFTFNILYEQINMLKDPKSPTYNNSEALKGFVCIVDDDALILQLCAAFLKKHNINYLTYSTAEDLLNNLPKEAPSMILADIRLPGKDGFELCKLVKEHYNNQLKVIALTAQALPEEKSEILQKGFDDILLKPFKEKDLMALFSIDITQNKHTSNSTFTEDLEELKEIHNSYIKETTQDILELNLAIAQKDYKIASLLLHKLAGRTAQLGKKELGKDLRILEIKLFNHPENFNFRILQDKLLEVEDFISFLKEEGNK